jgi:lipopolysaccharide biosynthesis protein
MFAELDEPAVANPMRFRQAPGRDGRTGQGRRFIYKVVNGIVSDEVRFDERLWTRAPRRHFLHDLAGSAEIVGSILEAFRRDPRLGMVMPQHWERVRGHMDWPEVFFVARDLAHRMGIRLSPAHVIDFPSGSMFWARPGALKPALNLGLRVDDFPVESGQHEDTLAHTIERCSCFPARPQATDGQRYVMSPKRLIRKPRS